MGASPRYESIEEARGELESRGVAEGTIDELFAASRDAAEEVVNKYDVGDEVDVNEVSKWLMISACESVVQLVENDVWPDAERGVRELVKDMDRSAETLVGGNGTRSRDMAVLFGAMLESDWRRR